MESEVIQDELQVRQNGLRGKDYTRTKERAKSHDPWLTVKKKINHENSRTLRIQLGVYGQRKIRVAHLYSNPDRKDRRPVLPAEDPFCQGWSN